MNEEKKLDEKTLEAVTGGYEYSKDETLRRHEKDEQCQSCQNRKTDACPHRDDMIAYYSSFEECPVYCHV